MKTLFINRTTLIGFIFITFFFIGLAKILIPRIGAFGCFDDCFNYVAGYFLGEGKHLYSEIFFNHQMIPAYMSYAIQGIFEPQTIYELIRRHREFLLLWGLGMNVLLFLRFGPWLLGFTVVYELSKYYVFGDRFLAEAILVYPLVYCVGIAIKKSRGELLKPFDYYFSAVCTWFILFSREPFVPVSLLLFIYILWSKKFDRVKRITVGSLFFLSVLTVLRHPLQDYFFQVFEINRQAVVKPEQIDILAIVFYPISVFIGGTWNIFRLLVAVQCGVFLTILLYLMLKERNFKTILLLFTALALTNIRSVPPGTIYYEAFHMAPWWGVIIFVTWFLAGELFNSRNSKNAAVIFFSILFVSFAYFIFHRSNYIYEVVDRQTEFSTNYGNDFVYGEVVRLLADQDMTLFLDGWDDLIYWQAKKISPYKYSWYTSSMPYFPKFTDARKEMFLTKPPDFYYGNCDKNTSEFHSLPDTIRPLYVRFLFSGKPTCLYVLDTSLSKIPHERFQFIENFNFSIER